MRKKVIYITLLGCLAVLLLTFTLHSVNSTLSYAILAILLITLLPLFSQYKKKFDIFEPKWIVLSLYLLYIVISPMYHIFTGNMAFLSTIISHRTYERAMLMASISVLFLWLGYYSQVPKIFGNSLLKPNDKKKNINKVNLVFSITVICSFFLWLTLVDVSITRFLLPGILSPEINKFTVLTAQPYLFNFAFESWIAILVIWSAFAPNSNKWLRISIIIIIAIIYASYGARYRLLMLGSIFIVRYLVKGKRPNIFKLGTILALLGIVFTWIGTYRWSVRSGISIEITSFFDSFFKHNRILEPFAKIIEYVPTMAPFELGKSFIYTLLLPIPRSIWPSKPDPNFRNVLEESIGSNEAYGSGLAYPNFGEYYQNFGFFGMIIIMFFFGMFLSTIYNWYLNNQNNRWVLIIYSIFLPFLYQVISRGYLGMIIQEAAFIFFPIFAMLFINNKLLSRRNVLISK